MSTNNDVEEKDHKKRKLLSFILFYDEQQEE